MKNKFVIILGLLFLLLPLNVFAETALTAEVDRPKLTTDDTLTYKLTISSTEKNIPPPELPKFEGFSVLSRFQSSAVSIDKGGLKAKLNYTYILKPKAAGKFRIAAAKLTLQKKTYASPEFEIEVKPGEAKSEVRPQSPPTYPSEAPPGSDQPEITL